MQGLCEACADSKGVQLHCLRLLLCGERVSDIDTPDTLELEDGAEIDAFLGHGGC
jgi:hypothetical protein